MVKNLIRTYSVTCLFTEKKDLKELDSARQIALILAWILKKSFINKKWNNDRRFQNTATIFPNGSESFLYELHTTSTG